MNYNISKLADINPGLATELKQKCYKVVGEVFATMMAAFWNKTVLYFWIVQELALKHKTGRTGRWAEGHRHHEWCFLLFFSL